MEKKLYYISHVVRDELPNKGLQKAHFYTKEGDKYYWGTDNNSFSEDIIESLEKSEMIIKLPRLIEFDDSKKETLWTDSEGKAYIADCYKPFSKKLKALEGILLK